MSDIQYEIRRSTRARNLILQVSYPGKVTLTLPPKQRMNGEVKKFIQSKEDWIRKNIRRFRKSAPKRYSFKQGSTIPFMGKELTLFIKIEDRKFPKIRIYKDILLVSTPANLNRTSHIREAVTKSYKRKFAKIVADLVDRVTEDYSLSYNRIAIKDNKTNWGSCSSKKNLNFNWRLIFAPKDVIEYVVIHEVCHLKEQNHSSRFWKLVEQRCPDYLEKRKWLNDHGHTLRL